MNPHRINVFFDTDSECYIAVDLDRPGCCAAGDTRAEAIAELQDARDAWDEAKKAAGN